MHQLGVEAAAEIWGTLVEKRLIYKVAADVLVPLAFTELAPGDDRSAADLTNFSLLGALSVKVVSWASLDYELKLLREPQLIDQLQVQNNLVATFGIATGNIKAEDAE